MNYNCDPRLGRDMIAFREVPYPKDKVFRVEAQDVIPGMVLGRPLLSSEGMVLLNEATSLTAAHVARLMTWGIRFVYVADRQSQV